MNKFEYTILSTKKVEKIFPAVQIRSLVHSFNRSNPFVQSGSFVVRSLRSFVQLVRPMYACVRALCVCVYGCVYVPINTPESCGSCALPGWIDRKRDSRKDGTNIITASRKRAKKFQDKNGIITRWKAVFEKKLKKIAYPALKTLAYSNIITNFAIETRQ